MSEELKDFRLDGIINRSKFGNYEHSELKILWLLKEPYLEKRDNDWSLIKFLADREERLFKYKHWYSTWTFVIKASWGLLNNNVKWEEIPPAKNIADILDYIAVVNINKKGGGKSTDMLAFHAVFGDQDVHKPILQQIDNINPDIVIGGSTLPLFYQNKILFNTEPGIIDFDGKDIWGCKKDGRQWIDGYHPNQRKISQKNYYLHIIDVVKQ